METNRGEPLDRPNTSRVLSEIREMSRRTFDLLPPGHRMEVAFELSKDARQMRTAGLRSQGFSEPEIRAILGARQL